MRRARVGADGLDADADQAGLVREPMGALAVEAGRVRAGLVGVEEGSLVVRAGVPAGAQQQPAVLGQRAVLGLEGADVVDVSRKSGSSAASADLSIITAGPTSRCTGTEATSSLSLPLTQWIGASKCVPTCSPISSQYHAQAGPRSS